MRIDSRYDSAQDVAREVASRATGGELPEGIYNCVANQIGEPAGLGALGY
jgi:hypothetical protein